MPSLRIPSVLRPLADGQPIVEIDAVSLGDLPSSINAAYPQLAARYFAPDGTLRGSSPCSSAATMLAGSIRERRSGPTPELLLLPAVSGG